MAIQLKKGQKVDLTKGSPGLRHLLVGLGWDIGRHAGRGDFDLDASVFLLGANGKVRSDRDFVFYGNLRHESGSVEHLGNNTSRAGSADTEQIRVDLGSVPSDVEKITIAVAIYDAESRHQSFGQISSSYIRIVDEAANSELMRFDLNEGNFTLETSVVAGEIYRYKGEWKFTAIGSGFRSGLQAMCGNFGVTACLPPRVRNESGSVRDASARVRLTRETPARTESVRTEPVGTEPVRTEPVRSEPVRPEPPKPEPTKPEGVRLVPNGSGEIRMELSWEQPEEQDLNLGCLVELADGKKGAVQAFGKAFGSLERPPYIAVGEGNTLCINGARISEIKRILVYAFYYKGVPDWRAADGALAVKCPGHPDFTAKIDEYESTQKMCAIALLENRDGESLTVEKIVRFFNGHQDMDHAFSWGLRWVAGRK